MTIKNRSGKFSRMLSFGKALLVVLPVLLLFNPFAIASDLNDSEPKRVLIIYSYNEGLPWERIIDDSLRATLASKSAEPIELNVEHADRIRYPDDAYLHNFVNLLRHRYSYGYRAHKINQPLAAILSNTQAAIRFLNHENPDLDEVREALSDIVQDDKRAADVIRRLRRMVKKEEPVHELFDINTVIEAAIYLLDSEITSQNISLLKDLKSGIPALYSDPIQIQQVVINLLTNAMHAMKDRAEDSRRVFLSTRFDRDKGVAVTVIDSGPGLTTDQIETVFNPY